MKNKKLLPAIAWFIVQMFLASNLAAQAQYWLDDEAGPLSATGTIKTFSLEGHSSGPTTVTVADDGKIWFTLGTGNAIGRMRADGGELTIFPLPNADSSPRIICIGGDGNIWFSEHTGNRMGKITPDGLITEYELPTPNSQPRAIALGSDGNIWIGMFAAGKIGRITPAGEITEFDIPTPNSGPRALAAGPDGNVWFSEFYSGKIGRITPQGDITEYELTHDNAGPGDITAGVDGAMWFLQLSGPIDNIEPDGNRVGRISMDGDISEFDIPAGGSTAINMAVGPDNNVWFTKAASLWRITPQGEMKEFPVAEQARTVGVSAGSDRQPPENLVNRLWFTDPLNNNVGYMVFE